METYCVICKKNTTNKNSSGRGTKKKKKRNINAGIKLCCLWKKKTEAH